MLSAFTQKIWCEVLREDEMIADGNGNGNGRGLWGFESGKEENIPGDKDGEYVPRVS